MMINKDTSSCYCHDRLLVLQFLAITDLFQRVAQSERRTGWAFFMSSNINHMTVYQRLEKLNELEKELVKWKREFKDSRLCGTAVIDILEKLIIQITLLKVDLGIKIKL